MSSVTSSAPLSLIWRGTWQASGVNSNGYQRYDCVTHAVTSPTARTDIYFAVTEIASGGAEPNPTSGQTTWKLLLEGGTIAASDGSIVYHDAEGNNVLVQAAADRILEVVEGIPQFVQRDPAPVATFEGYKLPSSTPHRMIPSGAAFWISGDRVFGLGTMQEGYISPSTDYVNVSQRITPTPYLFVPRDDDAQVPIGKIFHGWRCVMAIGKDDKSKVYGLGLNAGRFGDGTNDNTTFVYDNFQKIDFFEDNSINIDQIVLLYGASSLVYTVSDTANADASSRNFVAIAYFIQEIVDVGGVDTGGNVYISAGSNSSYTNGRGGITADGTVRQLTGFDQPIIGGSWYSSTIWFWSKRKIYALGAVTTTAGAASVNVATVTEIASFDSDIAHFYPSPLNENTSGSVTLADGRAYYYNHKPTINTRTTTLFEQIPVIDGKLFRKVLMAERGAIAVALMDDNTVYLAGRYRDQGTLRTVASLTQIELPYDMEIQDIHLNYDRLPFMITTDGNVIANVHTTSFAMMLHPNYRMDVPFADNNITLYADPGWAGRAVDLVSCFVTSTRHISIQTEDGYIYSSNTLSTSIVDEDDNTIATLLTNTTRPLGVNFQAQVLYTTSTSLSPLAGSYRDNNANAFTGLMSYSSTQTDFGVVVNGSMVQRPTLRSYQVT